MYIGRWAANLQCSFMAATISTRPKASKALWSLPIRILVHPAEMLRASAWIEMAASDSFSAIRREELRQGKSQTD